MQTALTSGSTYYFRVRVKESVTGTWSSWSGTQSFTYTSATSPSEWYQTEGTQFDGGTLTRTSTTTGAVQLSTTTNAVPTLVSGWTSNTATSSATLVLTKPSNIEVGDLLLILLGNDDITNKDEDENYNNHNNNKNKNTIKSKTQDNHVVSINYNGPRSFRAT